jgi:hypothetical protein
MEAIWSESIINPFPLFLILTKEEGKGKKLGDNMKKRYLSSFSPKKMKPLSILIIFYIFSNICNISNKFSMKRRLILLKIDMF